MARNKKNITTSNIDEATTVDVISDLPVIKEEIIPIIEEFKEGDELVLDSFHIRSLIGIKGKYISEDQNGFVTIEMANSTRVLFKKEHLKKVV